MKHIAKFATVLSLILVFAFAFTITASAKPVEPTRVQVVQTQESQPLPDLGDLANTVKNLTGLALLIPALINVGKSFGAVDDDKAPAWSLGLNTAALVGLVVLQISGHADAVPALDAKAGALAIAINSILALMYQLFVSRIAHQKVLAGMPVIGHSFTGRKAGEGPALEVDALSE
jgi:hypothetical protein